MLYGIKDIGRNTLGLNSLSDKLRKHEFWAVDDVSFEVKKGETLGIIGPNGSGKTTILKMLNGIFWPDKGKITIEGKTGALIAVGAGFHPMLTGKENVYLNAAILGMNQKEIDRKFDDIVEFADIGDFIDTPVKFYSSGMFVRLGFSVAVHCEPDILLIDEILSVGDGAFQAKCLRKMRELKDSGTTIIFVSHNLHSVRILCEKTILLFQGEIKECSNPENAIKRYYEDVIIQKGLQLTNKPKDLPYDIEEKVNNKDAEITDVKFIDKDGIERNSFKTGEEMTIRIYYLAHKQIEYPTFTFGIYSIDGSLHAGHTTKFDGYEIKSVNGSGIMEIVFEELCLSPGLFELSVSIADKDSLSVFDWHQKAYKLRVMPGWRGVGLFYHPHYWKISSN